MTELGAQGGARKGESRRRKLAQAAAAMICWAALLYLDRPDSLRRFVPPPPTAAP